jgi:predicted nucleotidyltransferase component of viral defense system
MRNQEHEKTIRDFLSYTNRQTDKFILKGGTALYLCYKLDRFSEDVDLDSRGERIERYVSGFCEKYNYRFRMAKDTPVTERFMIYYHSDNRPLKVEVSHRRRAISPSEYSVANGMMVFNIDSLCVMKSSAYLGRDRIHDVYDLAFICNNHYAKGRVD